MVKQCSVCGTTNDDNAVSCWNCDTVLPKNKSFKEMIFGPSSPSQPYRVMPGGTLITARPKKPATKKKGLAKKKKPVKKKIVHTKKTKKVKRK